MESKSVFFDSLSVLFEVAQGCTDWPLLYDPCLPHEITVHGQMADASVDNPFYCMSRRALALIVTVLGIPEDDEPFGDKPKAENSEIHIFLENLLRKRKESKLRVYKS